MEKKPKKIFADPHDGEYLGNIWGWKVSFWGLAVIILLGSLILYRHIQVGTWSMVKEESTEQELILKDSTDTKQ